MFIVVVKYVVVPLAVLLYNWLQEELQHVLIIPPLTSDPLLFHRLPHLLNSPSVPPSVPGGISIRCCCFAVWLYLTQRGDCCTSGQRRVLETQFSKKDVIVTTQSPRTTVIRYLWHIFFSFLMIKIIFFTNMKLYYIYCQTRQTRLIKNNGALKVQLKTWQQQLWLLLKTTLCHQINRQKEIKSKLYNPESPTYKLITHIDTFFLSRQ